MDDKYAIYTVGWLNEKLGNYEEALMYYDLYINNDYYGSYRVEHQRKQLLIKLKRFNILINEYDEKLNTLEDNDENNWKILRYMEEKALVLYMDGQYDESYNYFKKISLYWPKVLATDSSLAYKSSWYEELTQFLKIYRDIDEFFKNLFEWDKEGLPYFTKFKRDLSLADRYIYGEVLIKENPGNIQLLEFYAKEAGAYNEYALKCLFKILDVEPENLDAIDSIIKIYSDIYSKDKAINFIDSKLNNPNLRLYLLKYKLRLLESMTLYPESISSYEDYFKCAYNDDKDLLSLKANYSTCMELYALDLYNQNKLEESFCMLKKAYSNYNEIRDKIIKQLPIAWYENVLKNAIRESEDDYEKFFDIFYNLDDKKTQLWTDRIELDKIKFEPQKLIGNKSYFDILALKNQDNFEFLISEARKYYRGVHRPKIALSLFEKVLRIDPKNKEVLNQKFKMLVSDGQYDKAYELLKKLPIDYFEIIWSLKRLANEFISLKEYDRAKYCLNTVLNYKFDYEIIKKLKHVWNKSSDTKSQIESLYYIDWINLINHKHNEKICPECGSKLIPIKYGVILATDMEFKHHKYYASEDIQASNNRPTDYCINCHKELYLGLCGIDITEENRQLSWYTKLVISWLVDYLEENSGVDLRNDIYEKFSINKEECDVLLNKLVDIGFVEMQHNLINLYSEYGEFKHSIDEMYHFNTKIFKNKDELKEYSNTIKVSKEYSNVGEYIEDIKICMISGWNHEYDYATEVLKGDETMLLGDLETQTDAWSYAMEVCFIG